MSTLGKLKTIDLRAGWPHEAYDFTQWLALPENMQELSDEIGLSLGDIQTEVRIGGYKVDMVAVDEDTDKKVIIENQLEYTDHKHLGQIITYAAGYNASLVIWIVKDVREEHKKAIEWLNNATHSDLGFFLIKMELWQIEDSPFAPKFNIVVEPNDWAKSIADNQPATKRLTETKGMQLGFWSKFKEFIDEKHPQIRAGRKPRAQHWYNISFGTSEAHIMLTINSKDATVGCGIYISNSPELYKRFHDNKDTIEAETGALQWMELEGKNASRIKLNHPCEPDDEEKWPELFEWLSSKTINFQKTFSKYI